MRRAARGGRGAGAGGARLTRRGVVCVVASAIGFIGAYALDFRQLLYVAIALAAMPLIALVLVRARRPRLSVTRGFSPAVVAAGSAATVTLHVHNLAGAPTMRVTCWDEVPWEDDGGLGTELPVLQPRGARFNRRGNSATLEYELRPPRRGILPIGPFVVQLTDAFGFARNRFSIGETRDIVVTPEVIPLAETALSVSAGDGLSRLVQRRTAGNDDDAMTREYRAGDAMRRVHWRATARHGDLMVRQEEQHSFPEARIIVDTRGRGYDDLSGDERTDNLASDSFEWAVSMLASVAVHLRRYGFLVTVKETGPPQLGQNAARRQIRHDEELLIDLAELHLTIASAKALDVSRSASNGPIVAIVGIPDSITLEWMLRQRHQGDVAVAFLVQSASARSSSTLREITERLTHAGWLVVPVHPDDDHAAAWDAVVFESGRSRVGS